jgi:hypothetical protein
LDYGVVNENRIKFQVKVHYRMLIRVESTPRLETKAQRYVGNALPLAFHTSELAIQVQEDMDSLLKITFST